MSDYLQLIFGVRRLHASRAGEWTEPYLRGTPVVTVQIEHQIRDYVSWRAAFERDPAGRQAAGVRRYRVSRPIDDPKYVLVDLEFDTTVEAERFVASMRGIWQQVEGTLIAGPRARIVECLDEHTY